MSILDSWFPPVPLIDGRVATVQEVGAYIDKQIAAFDERCQQRSIKYTIQNTCTIKQQMARVKSGKTFRKAIP